MAATILVSKTNRQFRSLIAYNLKQAGHQPLRADNAEQAMNLVQNALPDLVLLGLDAARTVRDRFCPQAANRQANPMVADYHAHRAFRRAGQADGLDTGADDLHYQPFSPRELNARIKAVLRRRARR